MAKSFIKDEAKSLQSILSWGQAGLGESLQLLVSSACTTPLREYWFEGGLSHIAQSAAALLDEFQGVQVVPVSQYTGDDLWVDNRLWIKLIHSEPCGSSNRVRSCRKCGILRCRGACRSCTRAPCPFPGFPPPVGWARD